MKRLLSYTACIIALGTGSISSTAIAQTTAPGPYYATPSWDQTLPSNTRFIVLSNMNSEAVLDRETGLVWERAPAADRLVWLDAVKHCYSRTTGGRKGWRLPTLTEQQSLVDPTQSLPALPVGHPFIGILFESNQFRLDFYQSSTSVPAASFPGNDVAFRTNYRDGSVSFGDKTFTSFDFIPHAWCVRAGEGVDPR
jgi:Protein of unknown function (DUF1566)